MEKFAKFIHQAQITFLPTSFPVKYYGMPNGKVYILFARLRSSGGGRSSQIEYVLAQHLDFDYNYQTESLIPNSRINCQSKVFNEMVDNPDPKTKVLRLYRSITSFTDAYSKLNQIAKEQLTLANRPITLKSTKKNRSHLSIA